MTYNVSSGTLNPTIPYTCHYNYRLHCVERALTASPVQPTPLCLLVDLYLTALVSSGNLEVTVDFLTEIDRLVQLIESPIFTCECFLLLIIMSANFNDLSAG